MYARHFSGTPLSWKMASTGHSGTHASQSMQWSGSMNNICSPSWKQSHGQTATQSVYLQPWQGSVTTKAMFGFSESLGDGTPAVPLFAHAGAVGEMDMAFRHFLRNRLGMWRERQKSRAPCQECQRSGTVLFRAAERLW